MMVRLVIAGCLTVALIAIVVVSFRPPLPSNTALPTPHQSYHLNHVHTHDGPFGHGHVHAEGVEEGVTHSHPHQHPHQHRRTEPLESEGWLQVQHRHDDRETAFYARCSKTGPQFRLEFLATDNSNKMTPILPAETIRGHVYLGTKGLGAIEFSPDGDKYLAVDTDSVFVSPILTVVLSQIPLAGKITDYAIPVRQTK